MTRVLVSTALGVARVDTESGHFELLEEDAMPLRDSVTPSLPLLVSSAQTGSRVVAVLRRRPPLVVSDDTGTTWRELGGGLPAGVDVDIDPDDPDLLVFASASRLYVSRNGGLFWRALDPELPGITAVAWEPS
jgi:hypothetical protein